MIKSVFIAALVITMMGSVVNAEMIRISDKGVVYDTDKQLIWQDTEIVIRTWQGAMDYCENLNLGGLDDWILPDKDALKSLYPKKASLQNFASSTCWSSTTVEGNARYAWLVDFYDGDISGYVKTTFNFFRCVRSGQLSDPFVIELNKQIEKKRIATELKQKEDNAWNNASSLNTISAYKAYLKQYPNGTYVSNVKENLYELSPARIAQRKKEAQERAIREAQYSRTSSSSSSSYYQPKYKCSFKCVYGAFDMATTDKIEVKTNFNNSYDAMQYIKKEYSDFCGKTHREHTPTVSYPDCSTY